MAVSELPRVSSAMALVAAPAVAACEALPPRTPSSRGMSASSTFASRASRWASGPTVSSLARDASADAAEWRRQGRGSAPLQDLDERGNALRLDDGLAA